MKNTLILIFLFFGISLSSFSQTIDHPSVEQVDDRAISISKIETTDKFTVVTFAYTARSDSSWAEVNKEIFIQTNIDNTHYNFVKAENITIAPVRRFLTKAGSEITFKIYFDKIPAETKSIDIIERAGLMQGPESYFNFYNVSLSKSQRVKITDVVLTPPPPSDANFNFGNNMGNVFNSMAPMVTSMTTAMMDAQLAYYKQPGKVDDIAKLNKKYFNALLKAGFNADQALKIIVADSLLPKPSMGK
jgi:hypothetical protein